MITTNYQIDNCIIVLSPNRSASWRDSKRLLILFSIPVLIIAMGWSFSGAWLILPFAGLELMLFAYLMYKVSYRTYEQQLIRITQKSILVESGFRHKRQIILSRVATHVQFTESEQDWELPVITLICPAQKVEVGQFLNLSDRKQLKLDLEKAGLVVCRSHWWKQ